MQKDLKWYWIFLWPILPWVFLHEWAKKKYSTLIADITVLVTTTSIVIIFILCITLIEGKPLDYEYFIMSLLNIVAAFIIWGMVVIYRKVRKERGLVAAICSVFLCFVILPIPATIYRTFISKDDVNSQERVKYTPSPKKQKEIVKSNKLFILVKSREYNGYNVVVDDAPFPSDHQIRQSCLSFWQKKGRGNLVLYLTLKGQALEGVACYITVKFQNGNLQMFRKNSPSITKDSWEKHKQNKHGLPFRERRKIFYSLSQLNALNPDSWKRNKKETSEKYGISDDVMSAIDTEGAMFGWPYVISDDF